MKILNNNNNNNINNNNNNNNNSKTITITHISLHREEREHSTKLSELAPCESLVVLQLHLHLQLLSQSGSLT